MTQERTLKPGGLYRHFKGGLYRVLSIATHSETLEPYAVYQALYGEQGIWVRPLEMFLSLKEHEGRWVERFQEVPETGEPSQPF